MAKLVSCRWCRKEVSSEAVACPHCGQPFPIDEGLDEAKALASSGNMIQAIKLVRERTGMGLADAKHLVDSWGSGKYWKM